MVQYIRFTFENMEPIKIADDSSSQGGQINALSYITGSTLRGSVVNAFARAGELESVKSFLLSDEVAFLNAYIMVDDIELIPSLKGFYEDKTDAVNGVKHIENLIADGSITVGNKRASLGGYCYMKDDRIHYTGVKMGSDMKINKGKNSGKKNVFRNEYIVPGYRFAGYIAVPDGNPMADKLEETIKGLRDEDAFFLGGSRSFGYGKCKIREVERTDSLPYAEYALHEPAKDCIYMALLSNMTMINKAGEIVGLDSDLLKEKLGLTELDDIGDCATSVVDVRGYNRTWQAWTPAVKMYEMGSVFKLEFPGREVSVEKMNTVMNEGIGIRTNEGFGRVLFLNRFDKINEKEEFTISPETNLLYNEGLDDEDTLKIAAKGYYGLLIDRAVNVYLADPDNGLEKFGLKGSQLGTIESILYANLYNKEDGFQKLQNYFATAKEKDDNLRVQQNKNCKGDIAKYIDDLDRTKLPKLLDLPEEVMGIPFKDLFDDESELNRIKQELIISQIKFMNRGGIDNE